MMNIKGIRMKKITEILENILLEMAISKKDAEYSILRIEPTITYHLLKIFIYNNSIYVNKWKREIISFLIEISELNIKGINQRNIQNFYYINFIRNLEKNRLEKMFSRALISNEELIPNKNFNYDELKNKLISFYKNISNDINKLSSSEIDILINKYFL
jgi:hypothetical protein